MDTTSASVTPARADGGRFLGHPPGLAVLFLTQMWAEFSYFGLQALLVYYMTEQLGFSQAQVVADLWRLRRGGVLQPVLRRHRRRSVAGAHPQRRAGRGADDARPLRHGLSDPCCSRRWRWWRSAMACSSRRWRCRSARLYADDDPRKAHAFSAYYMGINLGGFLAPLVCGSPGRVLRLALGVRRGRRRHAGGALHLSWLLARRFRPSPRSERRSPAAAGWTFSAPERRDLALIAALVGIVVLFRIGYEQSGNVIALWVRAPDRPERRLCRGCASPFRRPGFSRSIRC